MSAQEMITEHLDLWTSAVKHKSGNGRGNHGKIELTGIKKLRELILELAVRGKLVEQDPNDEPASVLLERVAEEKARLVKEGKIKKPRKLPEIDGDESHFPIPSSWAMARLGEIVEIVRGITFPASEKSSTPEGDRIACLRTSNVQDRIEWDDILYIRDSFVSKSSQYVRMHDIVMSMANSRELVGKVAIIEKEPSEPTSFGGFLGVIRPILLHPRFLMAVLRAPHARTALIGGASQTTNIANISIGKLNPFVVGVPPLDEQNRIVDKVDELMALCDRLEQRVGDQREAHEVLVDTLLDALIRSSDATELAENWASVAEHFDTLFTTEDSIEKLKQTILQLAVMGRLVEQDPDDEPASVLLEMVAEEKERLVKKGKIKKPKRLPPIENNERSYQVHENWAWVRFQDIASEISTGPFGSMIHKHDYVNNGTPLINPSHMINGSIQEDVSVSISPQKAEELSSYKLNESDIVMARRGEVGRCAIVSDREAGWLCGTGSFVLRFHETLSRRFILMMFATDGVRRYLSGNSVGTTMTNLNHGILNRMPVALPPINEQHRIVQKVDELMALCDQLKARLSESGKTRSQLAETVVEQAVS